MYDTCRIALAASLFLAALACDGSAPPIGATGTTSGDALVSDPDSDPFNPIEITEHDVPHGQDGAGTGDDAEVVEGGFGWPCVSGDDCNSGLCVEGPEGPVCTKTCFEACGPGWDCKPLSTAGRDVTVVCVATYARLCWPCSADADCKSATTDPGSRCVSHGDAGSFCGATCGAGGYCPDGYACEEVVTTAGVTAKQCVPESGVCGCTDYTSDLGLQTDCWSTNDLGQCPGVRRCEEGALTSCDARTPAQEVCDGIDNDCDGEKDGPNSADCVQHYVDTDGDTFGIGLGQCLCDDPGAGYALQGGDCNDVNGGINPTVKEVCNFADDDCDGATDEEDSLGCVSYYPDEDGDGAGGVAEEACVCGAPGPGYILVGGDCNDDDETIGPGSKEVCDGVDNDCDGETDEQNAAGCTVYYPDVDGDGFGQNDKFKCLCEPTEEFYETKGGDCDDLNPNVKPFALEVCNMVDDDCDGVADQDGTQGCSPFNRDADEDTFGVAGDVKCFCGPKYPYTVKNGDDCNDANPLIHPLGVELCDNIDNNCNNKIDEGNAQGEVEGDCTWYWQDKDKDTFGAGEPKCLCKPDAQYKVENDADCNDSDPTSYPGGQETCAPADENCNGVTNEEGALGCVIFYKDEDGDGYGIPNGRCTCGDLPPYTAYDTSDCYDKSNAVYPGNGKWQTFHRGDGSFDYNCDGNQELQYTQQGDCDGWPGCDLDKGWKSSSIPGCGATSSWITGCGSEIFSCDEDTEQRTQYCR